MPPKPAPPTKQASSLKLKSPLLWTVLVLGLALLLYPLSSYLITPTPSTTRDGMTPHAPVPPSGARAIPSAGVPTQAAGGGEAAEPVPVEGEVVMRKFTASSLAQFRGVETPSNPSGLIYLAILGRVYDVTPGARFYGPGGAYNTFGGRDATVALAKNRVLKAEGEEEELAGGMEWRSVLTAGEWESVGRWEGSLSQKYKVVGVLV